MRWIEEFIARSLDAEQLSESQRYYTLEAEVHSVPHDGKPNHSRLK